MIKMIKAQTEHFGRTGGGREREREVVVVVVELELELQTEDRQCRSGKPGNVYPNKCRNRGEKIE